MATLFTKEYETLQQQLGVDNSHALPRLQAIVVSVGVGKHRDNKAYLAAVERDLAAVTGQKPHPRYARKAVSGFNVRQGNLVGYRVTLRGKRMEQFLQRFVRVTLPRVRDFQGLSTSALDGHGNLSVGLREHLPFPEVHPEKTDVIFGVQVTFVTTATTNEEGEALFRLFGFPFAETATAETV